jgi:transcriptional regulator with PAS, ATPase and Fis domain
VAISCAAIPRDLIEAELFGYRGGAFTGARREGQIGRFELADKGTLFLDEINGLPLDLQAKLLRALQQNEIIRLGDTAPISVDVRVIAASNTDLFKEVENRNFREDLYYRLNVVEIFIPPLRERKEDLELLIDHILERHSRELRIPRPGISEEALHILKAYSWPGNVRELENCLERAVLISKGGTIEPHHLPQRIRFRAESTPPAVSFQEGMKEIIEAALKRNGGNKAKASRQLRISRSTLYRKIKEYGLEDQKYVSK